MDDKTIALIWIASLIALVEIVALIKGLDGQLFLTAISTLGGLFGYYVGKVEEKRKRRRS